MNNAICLECGQAITDTQLEYMDGTRRKHYYREDCTHQLQEALKAAQLRVSQLEGALRPFAELKKWADFDKSALGDCLLYDFYWLYTQEIAGANQALLAHEGAQEG